MDKPWFMYDFTITYANPEEDTGYHGAHDIDIGAPPNYPVTALLPGTISSITDGTDNTGTVIWGRQVGIRLDQPYNGNPYLAYLHLSAVNPGLTEGSHVSKGNLVGWVGGASSETDYEGTSNPTGHNFLNTSGRSSRTQVGFALMKGPEYGHAGWTEFPDPNSNPTQIILDAQQAFLAGEENDMLQITDPFAAQYFTETSTNPMRWHCTQTNHDVIGGILVFYRKIGGAARLPISDEIRPNPHQNVVYQEFEAGVIVYDPDKTLPHPAGFDKTFLQVLKSEEIKKIVCG